MELPLLEREPSPLDDPRDDENSNGNGAARYRGDDKKVAGTPVEHGEV